MLKELIELAEYKHKIDLKRGEDKYLNINWILDEIISEIEETKAEIKENNRAKLEDELGDILWSWLILVEKLKHKKAVSSHQNIIKRALKKYKERILPLTGTAKDNIIWKEIKAKQKIALQNEKDN